MYDRLWPCEHNFPGDDFPNADSLIQAIFDAQEEEEAGQGQQQGQSHNPSSLEAAGESQASSTQKSKSTTHCMVNVCFVHVYIMPSKSESYMK